MNQPYIKQRDENGNVTNPIIESLISEFPNRRKRREIKNQPRFFNNRKSNKLTIGKDYKYKRVIQIEKDKDGDTKKIFHYISH